MVSLCLRSTTTFDRTQEGPNNPIIRLFFFSVRCIHSLCSNRYIIVCRFVLSLTFAGLLYGLCPAPTLFPPSNRFCLALKISLPPERLSPGPRLALKPSLILQFSI
ncbi:uncharacterized protein EURHEDRAFT_118699 [Aspergillus ruber CBS 135680]|uniref:Uncharacterized protein n=1 Tax=Aspergillus ruber (strain CBS 135680) TaxID=1388766 RepID=A0A017SRI8_ASPRC|nr:uncharacterized protein EURHEDRAFT_118699 [Aspergillus ruber CBS 135680]EYE98905.1 hypothetical protein EURHEDRAFT_118699 [Aspergillus ruber CBS 135680]